MHSRWNETDAARCVDALALRAYTSRLLGADPALVLHGGGNTSLKLRDAASGEDVLFVKGSGSDLSLVEPRDFAAIRLRDAAALLDREHTLDTPEMYALLERFIVRHPSPRPSVETLLHAALPASHVEHTHADAILAVANTEHGDRIVAELYGEVAPTVPYRHSGFQLAKACAEVHRAQGTTRTIGLVLRFHGAIAFGDDARTSYENMIRLAAMAEDYLAAHDAWDLPSSSEPATPVDRLAAARLRNSICRRAGFPLVMHVMRDPFALAFASRSDLVELCSHGPATPQHAIFGRRVPLVGTSLDEYISAYCDYLHASLPEADAARLDPTPRIAVVPGIGVCALGVDAAHARITAEVFRHDMEIMVRAQAHDRYRSAPAQLIARAELEYGGFEARERSFAQSSKPLLGQVAVLTAAAADHEPARVCALLARGAAVGIVGCPSSRFEATSEALRIFPLSDTTVTAWEHLLDEVVLTLGGIDMVVTRPEEKVVVERCEPLLALSPTGGQAVS